MHNCNSALQGSPTGINTEFSRSLLTLLEGQEFSGDGVYDKSSESHGLKLLSSLTVKKEKVFVQKQCRMYYVTIVDK